MTSHNGDDHPLLVGHNNVTGDCTVDITNDEQVAAVTCTVIIGRDWFLAPWVRPDCLCESCDLSLGGSWERGAENPAWLKYDAERSSPTLIFNHVRCTSCGPEPKD